MLGTSICGATSRHLGGVTSERRMCFSLPWRWCLAYCFSSCRWHCKIGEWSWYEQSGKRSCNTIWLSKIGGIFAGLLIKKLSVMQSLTSSKSIRDHTLRVYLLTSNCPTVMCPGFKIEECDLSQAQEEMKEVNEFPHQNIIGSLW